MVSVLVSNNHYYDDFQHYYHYTCLVVDNGIDHNTLVAMVGFVNVLGQQHNVHLDSECVTIFRPT